MDEIRRIQVTGGSTYIVSLPKRWVKSQKLKPKSFIRMTLLPDNTLLIRPYKAEEDKANRSKITLQIKKNFTVGKAIREFIASYLAGYNVIEVRFEEGMSTYKEKIKNTIREKLIGIVLLEESTKHLLVQCIINYEDLPLNKVVERICGITGYMIEDAVRALINRNKELADEVIKRDDEVDRFYFFAIRQLNQALNNPLYIHKIGLKTSRDCLGYRMIIKSIERIADHAIRIASIAKKLEMESPKNVVNAIKKFSNTVLDVYNSTVNSIIALDKEKAHNIIDKVKLSIAVNEEEITSMLFNAQQISSIYYKLAIDSLKRIAEYSSDIAEIIINLSKKTP